jgi:phage FluMu protein Com
MDGSRCPICKKRLMAMTDGTDRTQLVCPKCDQIDPMKTDAVKLANSSLVRSAESRTSAQSPRY